MLKRNPKILRHMTISYTIFLLIPIVMGSIVIYVPPMCCGKIY